MTKEYGMHSERLVEYSTETKCASSAIHEGWLSSNSSYFLLLGIKSSLPTKFWCTYLSVEDCCCCCCCCCWMEPDDDRWDSLLEVCLWVLSGLDCCWSKPSGLWRILVIVMPSLPPPIPESFFLEMFCSSGEYSWAVNIRVIVKDFYFTTQSFNGLQYRKIHSYIHLSMLIFN